MEPTDPYLTSSQHRLFHFTPASLSALRTRTNALAVERHREDLRRAIASGDVPSTTSAGSSANEGSGANTPQHPPPSSSSSHATLLPASAYPTAAEELKILSYYCLNALQISDTVFGFPSAVKAQALVYLSRLYLTTSCVTIHPKRMILPALHLATKTESYYTSVPDFVHLATAGGLSVTNEELIQPEITLAMGLQWSFTAWHPARGLEGVFLELAAIDAGVYAPPEKDAGKPGVLGGDELRERYRREMGGDAERRAGRATDRAKQVLLTRALLTDVYFLYTPAQITLAGLYAVDRELTEFYVGVKFAGEDQGVRELREKLWRTVRECAALLGAGGAEGKGAATDGVQAPVDGAKASPDGSQAPPNGGPNRRPNGEQDGVQDGDKDAPMNGISPPAKEDTTTSTNGTTSSTSPLASLHPDLLLRTPSHGLPMSVEEVTEDFKRDLKRIDKKLHHLNKPARSRKVDPAAGFDDEERRAKKRRLEAERRRNDEAVFGGALGGRE